MKNYRFFEFLQSKDGRFSHKRLISFMSFFVLVFIVIFEVWVKSINTTLILTFATLCGGQSALSILEKKD